MPPQKASWLIVDSLPYYRTVKLISAFFYDRAPWSVCLILPMEPGARCSAHHLPLGRCNGRPTEAHGIQGPHPGIRTSPTSGPANDPHQPSSLTMVTTEMMKPRSIHDRDKGRGRVLLQGGAAPVTAPRAAPPHRSRAVNAAGQSHRERAHPAQRLATARTWLRHQRMGPHQTGEAC